LFYCSWREKGGKKGKVTGRQRIPIAAEPSSLRLRRAGAAPPRTPRASEPSLPQRPLPPALLPGARRASLRTRSPFSRGPDFELGMKRTAFDHRCSVTLGQRRRQAPAPAASGPGRCRGAAAGRLRPPGDGDGARSCCCAEDGSEARLSGEKPCTRAAHTLFARHRDVGSADPAGAVGINRGDPAVVRVTGEVKCYSAAVTPLFNSFLLGQGAPSQASAQLLSQHRVCTRKSKACTHSPGLHGVPVLCHLASLAPSFL